MTVFASRTAASMNSDPEPYRCVDWRWCTNHAPFNEPCRAAEPNRHNCQKDPRPEFTPQTAHESNPILVAWRLVGIDEREEYTREVEQLWLETTTGTLAPNVVVHATADQIDHAHRVLQRLKHWTAAVPLGESA